MKAIRTFALPLFVLSVLAWNGLALADTAEATCEVRKDGETRAGATGRCSFSQRQGYASIDLRNGDRYELSPAGKPDHYRDQKGKAVVLTVRGNVNEYAWEGGKKIIVRFDGATSAAPSSAGEVGDTVSGLQDLVGARGGSAEDALEGRGYTWVRTEKSGDASFAYWRENENGQCIVVKTVDGRYESIVYGTEAGCRAGGGSGAAGHAGDERREEFKSVCGAIVKGENSSYRCTVVDFFSGDLKSRTILQYPDQKIELTWRPGNRVGLQFEGMVPQDARYSTSEGKTNFSYEGTTYFYYSNKELARREYDNFRN